MTLSEQVEHNEKVNEAPIPQVSVAELIALGITDIPHSYYVVVGTKGKDNEMPVLRRVKVRSNNRTFAKLPNVERALLKSFLESRQAFMDQQRAHNPYEGLGAAAKAISNLDFAVMARLTPTLQNRNGHYYKFALSVQPNSLYARRFGDGPLVGDVIVPGRRLSPDGKVQPYNYAFSKAPFQEIVCLFRPTPTL